MLFKCEVVRIKTQTGQKETLQKHVMTMTLEEAHKLYQTRNPQVVNERGHFKLKTDELNNIKVDLMKIHKHVCFK